MEDIIDIIVTETTNTIEITSQATDEIIDVNIIDNREDITLNVTPSLVEININSLTGNFGVTWGEITGTLADQTDLNTALSLKADLVGGKVPSSQLPSYVDDVVEVANYAALPSTGETGKIYVVLDTNKIYRWSGSAYIEIADSTAVWGAITGTLSSQTDLQSALNAKFDDPTGDTTQYIAGDGSLITFPVAGQAGTLVREVRNTTGATLTKGTIVYISGATGNKPTVSKAIATGDSTSAQTFGMCQSNISNNSNGYVVCVGDITGLDTSAVSEGVQLYLSSTTAGTYTTTKQYAPAHLVYIGVVTRSHPTQGQIEVKIQNGYELDELHNVSAQTPSNNDGLFYESSTSLWKNKSIATVLGYTPEQPLTFSSPLSRSTNAVSIPAASSSVNGYLSSTDWTTFNAKQDALTNPVTGTGATNRLAIWGGTNSITSSSNLYYSVISTKDAINFGATHSFISYADNGAFSNLDLVISGDDNIKFYTANQSKLAAKILDGGGFDIYGDLNISSTNPRIYLTDTDNNPDYFISNTDGTFTVYDVTNSLSRFTIGTTGNAYFRNAITGGGSITGESIYSNGIVSVGTYLEMPANNTVGGTNYYISQYMASNDYWRIYGNTVAADQGEMIFELGDNGVPIASNGQRFRFYYSASAGGTAKSPLTIDYNTSTFTTDLVGTAATFTSTITSTINNASAFTAQPTTGTSAAFSAFLNDGGQLYIGIDSSTASSFGKGNYAYNIYGNANRPMVFSTDGTARLTFAATSGTATFSSSVIATAPSNGIALQLNGRSSDNIGQLLFYANNATTLQSYIQSRPTYLAINTETNTPIYFGTNVGGAGGTRMTIAGGGNVGIGTDVPNYSLHINNTSTITRLQITNSTTGTFSANGFQIIQDGNNTTLSLKPSGFMSFETANVERMRITSGGLLQLSSSGSSGIRFGAGSSNLNYYEEGTWSPQIYYQNSTNQANSTNVTQVGTYTRVGNLVTVSGVLQWTLSGSAVNDNIGIKNLPFNSKTGADYYHWGKVQLVNAGAYPTDGYILNLSQNSTMMLFYDDRTDGGNYGDDIGNSGTKTARFTITYLAN